MPWPKTRCAATRAARRCCTIWRAFGPICRRRRRWKQLRERRRSEAENPRNFAVLARALRPPPGRSCRKKSRWKPWSSAWAGSPSFWPLRSWFLPSANGWPASSRRPVAAAPASPPPMKATSPRLASCNAMTSRATSIARSQALQESLKADPLFALGYAQLGEAYRMKYQTERDPKWLDLAIANCERAQQLDTRLPAAYSTLASIHNEQGKHDLALQEFNQALEINPRDPAAIRGIARSDETAGKIADAEAGFRKVIAVVPDDWRGYNELGNFYSRQGKYPQAIAQYKQALELTPDNAEVYSNLGSAYLERATPSSCRWPSRTWKRRLLSIRPTRCWPIWPHSHLQQGKYSQAVDLQQTGAEALRQGLCRVGQPPPCLPRPWRFRSGRCGNVEGIGAAGVRRQERLAGRMGPGAHGQSLCPAGKARKSRGTHPGCPEPCSQQPRSVGGARRRLREFT